MLGALGQVVPNLISGDLCGSSFPNAMGGRDERRGRDYVYYEAPAGGNGGHAGDDGPSAWGNIDFGNVRTIQSAEALEAGMPLLVERSTLRIDSGGEGALRGGLGFSREVRLIEGESRYSVLSDRAVLPPFGVGGASAAAAARVSVRRDGREIGRERVSDLRGALHHYGPAAAGWLVTTGQVLSGAREEAGAPNAPPVALYDGLSFCRLLEDHDVGVIRTKFPIAIPDLELLETLRG